MKGDNYLGEEVGKARANQLFIFKIEKDCRNDCRRSRRKHYLVQLRIKGDWVPTG